MKAKEFLKLAAVAAVTTGLAVGCSSNTAETTMAETTVEDCQGATPEVKNAIYAAKLKNARARNLGFEWRDTAKLIDTAEQEAEVCNNARAKILADKAEQQASDAIAQYHADQEKAAAAAAAAAEADSMSMGSYLVVSGDNLWNIAGQDSVYGNPYQWPLIYKANSGQIKDADLIFAGQYFDVPKAASGAEVDAAVEHAKTRGAWTLGETEASDLDFLSQ
jgi:nucleoid-associated protein YgaU